MDNDDNNFGLKRSSNWTAKLQQSSASPLKHLDSYQFPSHRLRKTMKGN